MRTPAQWAHHRVRTEREERAEVGGWRMDVCSLISGVTLTVSIVIFLMTGNEELFSCF